MMSQSTSPRLAILGAGVMGRTVLGGALSSGWSPGDIAATVLEQPEADAVHDEFGVHATTDNAEAVKGAAIIVIAVKPKDVGALLDEIGSDLAPGALVASVAVGLPTSFYESRLPKGTPVVRIMPNTPALVGAGASAISAGKTATEEHLAIVERLLSATGLVVRVPEKDQDAVAALSGSGPAYVFYLVDAMAEAGVLLGLSRELSLRLATQTVLGSAQLLEQTGDHPVILRERVSSPGGTTVAALRALDAGGVRSAVLDALAAARDRSVELVQDLAG